MASPARSLAALALTGALATGTRALSLDALALAFLDRNVLHGILPDLGFSAPTWALMMACAALVPVLVRAGGVPFPVLFLAILAAAPGVILGTALVIECLPVLLPLGAAAGSVLLVARPELVNGVAVGKRKKDGKKKA
jgi:hypothetical protein